MQFRLLASCLAVGFAIFALACGDNDRVLTPEPGPPTTTSVAIDVWNGDAHIQIIVPATKVKAGASIQLAAEVKGLENDLLVWEVVEGDSRGTISADLVYTAPMEFPEGAIATIRAHGATFTNVSATAELSLVPALSNDDLQAVTRVLTVAQEIAVASDKALAQAFWALSFHRLYINDPLYLGGYIQEVSPRKFTFTPTGGNVIWVLPLTEDPWQVTTTHLEYERWHWGEDNSGSDHFLGTFVGSIGPTGLEPLHLTHEGTADDIWVYPADINRSLSGSIALWGERWSIDVELNGERLIGNHHEWWEDNVTGVMSGSLGTFEIDEELYDSGGDNYFTFQLWWDWSCLGSAKFIGADGRAITSNRVYRGRMYCSYYGYDCDILPTWEGSGTILGWPEINGRLGLLPEVPVDGDPSSLILRLDSGGAVEVILPGNPPLRRYSF